MAEFGEDPLLSGLHSLLRKIDVLNNTVEGMEKRLLNCEEQTQKNTILLATIKAKMVIFCSLPGIIIAIFALVVSYMKKG